MANTTLPDLTLSEFHAEYLHSVRKLDLETAVRMGVRSAGKNLALDFRSPQGELLYRKVRIERSDGSKTFVAEPTGVVPCLWNAECLAGKPGPTDVLIVSEGEFDAVALAGSGAPFVVSVPNGANGRPGQGNIDPTTDQAFRFLWDGMMLKPEIAQFRKYVLAMDGDEPGRIMAEELAIRLGRHKCWTVRYPEGCKDANEVLVKYGEDGILDLIDGARPVVPDRLLPLGEIGDVVRQSYTSGWSHLDKHLKISPPELLVVTGSPGAGKSQFVLALVANLARVHGLKGAILQFEDHPERNRRDLLKYARAWQQAEANSIAMEPEAWINKMFWGIAPSEDVTTDYDMGWVVQTIEEAVTRHGAKWVVLDPWNEIEHAWNINESETAYTNSALRELKKLSRRLQVALIVVTHPTKAISSKEPDQLSLYDVSGSAAWNNKADHGIVIYRERDSDTTYVNICKSKDHFHMGKPGLVRMRFFPHQATFGFVGEGV